MGAGQIGGIATLLDIDFNNAAGFVGTNAVPTEANYMVYYLSHAMMFCVGALIEAHVILTPASCVYGERYKFDVYAGTHSFIERMGNFREVQHLCIHRGYNHTMRWKSCSSDNLALLLLHEQFHFHHREPNTDYVINRVRYGTIAQRNDAETSKRICQFYGWGSRRNGYLIPLLMHLRRVDVTILPREKCLQMWNVEDKFLCLSTPQCKDDLGSVLVCSGFLRGIMTSMLMDRPCGVGFIDLSKYTKFLTCGVDDSRDVLMHEDFEDIEVTTHPHQAQVYDTPENSTSQEAQRFRV